MAQLADHDIRDAEDALRKELALVVGRYTRRMLERGKELIKEELDNAIREGHVDGTAIGRIAAERAASTYFGAKPQSAIDSVSYTITGGTAS